MRAIILSAFLRTAGLAAPVLFSAGLFAGGLAAGGLARPALAAAAPADSAALLRLADRLRRLDEDGLDPRAYAVPAETLAQRDPAAWQAGLYRSALLALTDLLHGRVAELPNRADLRRDTAAVPLAPWLSALAAAPDPAMVLDRAALLPPEAAVLKRALALARARVAAGGFPHVPAAGPDTLEPGGEDPVRVPALRARLLLTDPLLAAMPAAAEALYDEALQAAVKRFQAAEGLEPDGRIGRLTFAALNRPAEVPLRQLRAALDMRRAAAPPPNERHIEVNVPHQRLVLAEPGAGGTSRVLLDMAVIVGKPARATPMLRVRLNAVQFNPQWGVPERNAREDLLPRFRRDPRAMMEKGFRVYGFIDGARTEIDPTTIDWASVNPTRFPYFIRQDAGDINALGRIKFIMPNTEDIYMHDTPDRHLFRRPDRAFSSGCIRLEKPMELLDAVLQGAAGWDRARAERVLASRVTTGVAAPRSIPVRLHYTTAVVAAGTVVLRPDIYGLDEAYVRAMDSSRTRVASSAAGVR
ncbi:murein L,D-transpeptidase [Paeniroseomonas aquatica]|uniref:L,D-transpeptidase family protein n=1 Tax=Paeniroseomonas aquatica TaxID=373043 RepID=A0ABT8A6L7_9PROT|nr:L,D-transpeptidase family protein [Paeniroseomonas aquatica]MDN3565323.1 L,D-transpeptidase family protein [Paeniroseomonas aquatica]